MKPVPAYRTARSKGSERGMVLVIVLVIILALSMAGVAVLSGGRGVAKMNAAQSIENEATGCAVTGVNLGLARKSGDMYGGGAIGALLGTTINQTTGTGALQCSLSVSLTDNDDGDSDTSHDTDGRLYIRGTATLPGGSAHAEALGGPHWQSAFLGGGCGCDTVIVNGTQISDSYDSLAGAYNAGTAGVLGSLNSNGNIELNGSQNIKGGLTAGGSISTNGTPTITGAGKAGGTITGNPSVTYGGGKFPNQNPAPAPCKCTGAVTIGGTNIDAATLAAKTNNLNVPGANRAAAVTYLDSLTPEQLSAEYPGFTKIGAGNYQCGGGLQCCVTVNSVQILFTAGSNPNLRTRLTFNGNQRCSFTRGTYYFERLVINGTGGITIDPNLDAASDADNVVFFWDQPGPYDLNGNNFVNTSDKALNLEIYTRFTGSLPINGSNGLSGVLYAPYATVDVNGTNQIYGAILAGTLNFNGTFGPHFDINLMSRHDYADAFQPLAGTWRVKR